MCPDTPRDDKQLLAAVARGDKAAMQVLYQRHHDPLYGFIRSRCCDAALAMDVVQDAMLDVWRSAARFSGKSSVRTWIFAIGRNKLVDRIRRSSQLSYVDEVPEQVDETPDAAEIIAASQDAGRLRACLDKLKKVQLAVIRLAFFDELPYGEIAEIEGVPVGTVKTRIHHAKQALMHCLGTPA